MKVLIAVDGSRYSKMCISAMLALNLPADTEFTCITVIPEHTFLGGIRLDTLIGGMEDRKKLKAVQEKKAADLVNNSVDGLRSGYCNIKTVVSRGKPVEQILKQATNLKADLMVIGAKGTSNTEEFVMGDTARKLMKHAHCNVLLVRENIKKIRRAVLATDGTEYSNAAAHFLLDLDLPSDVEMFIITVMQSHIGALLKMPTLNLETNQHILSELQKAEEKEARKIVTKLEQTFSEKGYDVTPLVRKGDPVPEILNCANTFNPELVVLGAKGHSGIEGFLMGSVSRRVARFSRYSVLIVRPTD